MNVDPVGFLPPATPIAGMDNAGGVAEAGGAGDFASWIAKEIASVNDKVVQSDRMLQKLATGEVDNLHQVMISLEQAKISFQLLVQVRNKLLDAYQDILRMQV
jgi:flagellar hook-basal body complex protein FliE